MPFYPRIEALAVLNVHTQGTDLYSVRVDDGRMSDRPSAQRPIVVSGGQASPHALQRGFDGRPRGDKVHILERLRTRTRTAIQIVQIPIDHEQIRARRDLRDEGTHTVRRSRKAGFGITAAKVDVADHRNTMTGGQMLWVSGSHGLIVQKKRRGTRVLAETAPVYAMPRSTDPSSRC